MAKKRVAKSKPTISLIGPGNLGSALATDLALAGYLVENIASQRASRNLRDAKALARRLNAKHILLGDEPLDSDIVWITVPDDSIAEVARRLVASHPRGHWRGRIVLHSSGALSSDDLSALRKKGASVASAHPMMSFVRERRPQWRGVPFDIEGDVAAIHAAHDVANALGAEPYRIEKRHKTLYHAFGSFASPLVIALLASLEKVAEAAGVAPADVKPVMAPLFRQTVHNYFRGSAAEAFSGPLIRGDVATIRKHLAELKAVPEAREVYVALARSAVKNLPVKNRAELEKALRTK